MAGPSFYPDVFARFGIEVVVPSADERAWLHEKYVNELLRNEFRDETRARVVAITERLRADRHIDALVLAGTELPLLLQGVPIDGLDVLDTTELHVRAIVRRLADSLQK